MSKRSVQITLLNNTPYTLTHSSEYICTGSWSDVTGTPAPTPAQNASLPETVGPNAMIQWQSEDSEFSVFTGTEGWVKYSIAGNDEFNKPVSELLWIHWNNPYIWDSNTRPLDFKTSLSDVHPTCGTGDPWPPFGTPSLPPLRTQLFGISSSGTGPSPLNYGSLGAEVWDWVIDWAGMIVQGLIDAESDVNLEYTLGLRQNNGSIDESIRRIYPGSKGLRALAVMAKQPSMRKLFRL
jgi:hypothetical protein